MKNNKKYIVYMIIISFVHTIIYFYLGFIFGFNKSPYSHDIVSILENIVVQIIPVILIEFTRGILLTKTKGNKAFICFITLFFILIEIDYSTLIELFANKEELFKYVCSTLLPIIARGILYTYLSIKSSFILPLIYRLFMEVIILLLPVLPNVDWFVIGSLSIMSPIVVYLLFRYNFEQKTNKKISFEKISYTITLTISILLVCFMLGLFKYEPIAILSSSMAPEFSRGDVVIYEKIDENKLNQIPINSVIIYSLGNQNIAHRVVDIVKENDEIFYQTKGDSNNVADTNLVSINQIKGVYAFSIKYIGFPSVWLHEYFHSENGK